MRRSWIAWGALAGVVFQCNVGLSGPLDPPMGPIEPTHKTLTEVEPRTAISATNTPGDDDSVYRITQPGSYYLTGNVAGEPGKHGIEIEASGVTLDLRGFELVGIVGAFSGIYCSFQSDVEVRGGIVRDWPGDAGVWLNGDRAVVRGLRVVDNADLGIYVREHSRVEDCIVVSNGSFGIYAIGSSTVARCRTSSNASSGVYCNYNCTIIQCSSMQDGSAAAIAIHAGISCIVKECGAYQSPGIGIRAGTSSLVIDSTASFCATGFASLGNAGFVNCSAYENSGNGFSLDDGSHASNCIAHSNGGSGFVANGVGCSIVQCNAFENDVHGIEALDTGCSVLDCTSTQNGIHGIVADEDGTINRNTCRGNGRLGSGAGIHLTGPNNRVEDNHCASADFGIQTATGSTRSIFIRNTCTGNITNYFFVANNIYGPIINATQTTDPVSGNSAPSTLLTTDPNANFRI